MRRSFVSAALLLSFIAVAPAPARADPAGMVPDNALGPMVSTSGVGASVAVPLVAGRLNFNTGFTAFGLSRGFEVDGSPFHGKVRVGAVPLYLTFYPFANWFNLQAGMVFNNNRASALAQAPPEGTIHIFGETYTAAQLGTVTGATHFDKIAPYIGIGFGQPFAGGRFTFTGNLGVMFEGQPGVRLRVSNPAVAAAPGEAAQLQKYQNTINHDARILQYYPILSFAVVYRF
jgi:hypothetical protein